MSSSTTAVPTTPPASSSSTYAPLAFASSYYTPVPGYSHTSLSISTTASEGPSNVPGNSIAASRAAASASSAAAAASSSAAPGKSSSSSLGLALGLGLGLGLLLLLGMLSGMYIIRQRRIQRLTFAKRASRIQQTMRSVDERESSPYF
ncbi:hypothetical protein JCM10908_005924 [Rhodotorula pacifica]|uniref:uncharacterized protein n=1 Tax=Rhodotorula pacifica TaxID=1495444 RepID=UPI0031718C1E